MIGGNLVKN